MEKPDSKCDDCQQALLSPADAVMAIAILAMEADRTLDPRELRALEHAWAANPLFDKVKNPGKYIARISATIAGRGREAILIEATGLLSSGLREAAYAWAVYVIAADGKTVGPEHKFLALLRRRFGIHGTLAGKINAVVPMLRRA